MNARPAELSFLERGSAEMPRVLIVSPHPDDEVIGAGSCLPRLRDSVVLQVTDGAPSEMADALAAGYSTRSAYAAARHGELREAVGLCGLSETIELHIPDQTAAYRLTHLTQRIEQIIRRVQPEFLITVPYEGGHPDHDATAFAVHQACGRLVTPPVIVEMLSYHHENSCCIMDRFLGEDQETLTLQLSADEITFKRRLFQCFVSQQHVLKWFPIRVEKFRVAPVYDFTQPPHEGQLYYEKFAWGLTGTRWCELAEQALSRAASACAS
jgi:LmbE family N-acetylglucosaminyl deacetylase